MLRQLLDFQLSLTEKGKPLGRFRPLVSALDTFFYEAPIVTKQGPHIRDLIDLKRWMMVVVYALVPCILMAIWNAGVQSIVYGSSNLEIVDAYIKGSYFTFAKTYFWPIVIKGLIAFIPVMLISYAVGGLWEVIFAIIRRHEVSEGFLVTGMLFALILPSTIPYWMVAVGVSAGVIIGKEIFGGTGMNILNPALVCRAFLFFAFPTKMTGPVWVGTNPTSIQESIVSLNKQGADGITQASALNFFNISTDIKRVHIEALGRKTGYVIERQLNHLMPGKTLVSLSNDELQTFVTTPHAQGGLGLSPENYDDAMRFADLQYGKGVLTNQNFFFGNRIGSMGETSILACLLGAIVLITTGIGSWRSMLGMALGAYACALLFEWGSHLIGPYDGAFNPAKFALPAYKHLLLGSLAFGLVFMATDPVSSPDVKGARWFYGLLCGSLVIVIRAVNPAYPEGVMLAILFGNVFAPLFDHIALNAQTKVRYARKKILVH